MKKKQIGITEQNEWDEKWRGIFDHYQHDLRHAYYINAILEHGDNKVLEIAAGSFRDMALLNRLGLECWGVDYSKTSVSLAKKRFRMLGSKMFQCNAFDMSRFDDNAFDVTFHNGFWVLFEDDSDIINLAKEQARISRNKIIATVHNGHNKSFVRYFRDRALSDPLYRIRFFEMEEIRSLMLTICEHVTIIPVGKGKKYFEDDMINRGIVGRLEMRQFFDSTGLKYLDNSERLLCIGYL